MKSINPATEELIGQHAEMNDSQLEDRLQRAEKAFGVWRRSSFAERAEKMSRAAELLRQEAGSLGRLITQEMGKPIGQSEAEIEKCARVCEYYAEHAPRFLENQPIETGASKSYVRYEPLGPILAIMPWNFPFWQVFRFAAPGLMAGNTAVLKHASNVCAAALAIEELFQRAGFPQDAMTVLLIASSKTADVIGHPAIRAVTLTGSDRAGMAVAEQAGRRIKKTVLELGGSDPFIVLADAEPGEAAKQAVKARTINSGQSCIAAKRFIVEQSIADEFEQTFTQEMQKLRVGDPLDRSVEVGPLARQDLLDELHDQVERSIKAGAKLYAGGQRLDRKGYFYAPTVLGQVTPGMPAFDEETFGPVAAVVRAQDRDQAIELANRSQYGLAASVWTRDIQAGENVAAQIEAGCVFVNGVVQSDPRLPFGGIKRSGYGRELSEVGVREFVNVKTIWIK